MTTVITHFFNEEMFLPWWLRHHMELFDHGILIDHGSTDRSVEICRELAPHWTVVKSKLEVFDAVETDFEVMNIETTVSGWKIALNTTEFLVARSLGETLAAAELRGEMGLRTHGVVMADVEPDRTPDPERPLLQQKFHGYVEKGWRLRLATGNRSWPGRRRLLHRYPHGAYEPGRHKSFRISVDAPPDICTCWFGYSPWTDWFKTRKTSFVSRIPAEDIKAGRGGAHVEGLKRTEERYRLARRVATDLRARLGIQSAVQI